MFCFVVNVTEGLETNEVEIKRKIVCLKVKGLFLSSSPPLPLPLPSPLFQASMLPNYGYNRGALLAASHLLGDSSTLLQQAAFTYVANFVVSSPWHSKVRTPV